jgi:succinoglycan biosynthesis transport protein ExoP
MVDELEEKPGEGLNLQQYMGVIRRRHLLFLIPFFLGWLVVWSASWVLPARYKWGTQIRVPTAYSPSNGNDDPQGRLQSISQKILSSTQLLHIVDELNLYSEDRGRPTRDELAERMRNDIKVEQVLGDERQITSVNIYYSAHDPFVAQQVTGELTNLFISENERMRVQESEDNTKFLEDQLETSHQNLVEQEEKVRVFKDLHPQLGSNFQILTGLRSELDNREDALNAAQQRNAYLLEQSQPFRPTTGDGPPIGPPALEQELDKLKAQRDDLISRGDTPLHPDVRKLNAQIALKEKAIADLKAGAPTSPSGKPPAATPDVDNKDAAVMIQHKSELKANQVEIANREREIAALKAKINDYQGFLSQEPALEQQFADLTRGYDQSKAHYDDLLNKKIASEMITKLLKSHRGELYRTIDLTRLPLKPDFPNRIKMCGIGLGVGLAFGTLLVGGTEYLDDGLYDEKALKETLPVTVISDIPVITSQQEERRQQRRRWLTWALTGFVFASILAGSAISLLRG